MRRWSGRAWKTTMERIVACFSLGIIMVFGIVARVLRMREREKTKESICGKRIKIILLSRFFGFSLWFLRFKQSPKFSYYNRWNVPCCLRELLEEGQGGRRRKNMNNLEINAYIGLGIILAGISIILILVPEWRSAVIPACVGSIILLLL